MSSFSAEADFKIWTLSNGIEVSAWASGKNYVACKTYLWATVGLDDDYVMPEVIEYQIVQPNEAFTIWQPFTANEVEEAGDPNLRATFIPEQKGCHRVTVKMKLHGEVEQIILEGLYFEVV